MSDKSDEQPKKSKNPFINMAQEAKSRSTGQTSTTVPKGGPNTGSGPKPTKGFGAPIRRSAGRGR
jgi:hypothetical protein